MALRYMNSMYGYANRDDIEYGPTQALSITNTNFFTSGEMGWRAWSMGGTDQSQMIILDPHVTTEALIIGCYAYSATYRTTAHEVIRLYHGNSVQSQLELIGSDWRYERGTGAAELIVQTGGRWNPHSWNLFEARILTHVSAGQFELRVNGQTVLSDTGLNNANSGTSIVTAIRLNWGSVLSGSLGPFWLLDDTGSALNTFTGGCRIEGHFPNSDGTRNDFTPSAGLTNYELVDDGNLTSGTSDYVSGSTVGDDELYGFPNLSQGITRDVVNAVGCKWLAQRMEPGERTMKALVRSNGSEAEGAVAWPTRIGLGYYADWFEQDPDGPGAWDEAAVNAAEVGYTIES